MADTPSITIVKKFTFQGAPEEFSNTYHFSGDTPSNEAGWKTLADAIILKEKNAMPSSVTFVRAYGYVAGNEISVAQIHYDEPPLTAATGQLPGSSVHAGDVCVWLRWKTADRNSRGRPIYLRKYFHGCPLGSSVDEVNGSQRTALVALGTAMTDGSLPGGVKVCGPQGAVAGAAKVAPFLSTRQLKRRGRRPS